MPWSTLDPLFRKSRFSFEHNSSPPALNLSIGCWLSCGLKSAEFSCSARLESGFLGGRPLFLCRCLRNDAVFPSGVASKTGRWSVMPHVPN